MERAGRPTAVFLERGARRGDLIARLLRERKIRDQPYAVHEQRRAQGPLLPGSLGLVTTSHPVAQEAMRSEAFGMGRDRSQAPRWVRWALESGDELDAAGVAEPPSPSGSSTTSSAPDPVDLVGAYAASCRCW